MKITDSVLRARKLWVAALRSGEYKQCKKLLTNGEGYCCLGVACDVYNKTHKNKVSLKPSDGMPEILNENRYVVAEWLRITPNGTYYDSDNLVSLIELNDIRGASFNEIANNIEQDLIAPFENKQ